jgi:hypothetical protein
MDKQIENLLKIINKAVDNGFNYCEWQYYTTAIPLCGLMEGNIKQLINTNYYKLLLLDKEFAKAFWGFKILDSKEVCNGWYTHLNSWQYNLQQLILEDDLIEYYTKFLEENK